MTRSSPMIVQASAASSGRSVAQGDDAAGDGDRVHALMVPYRGRALAGCG